MFESQAKITGSTIKFLCLDTLPVPDDQLTLNPENEVELPEKLRGD